MIFALSLLATFSLSNCGKDDDSENGNAQNQMDPSNDNNQEVPKDTTNNLQDLNDQTIDSLTVSDKVGNYTYVDLGLPSGLKWATCNVGATKPEEYGDYFAWGETTPKRKSEFTQLAYAWARKDDYGFIKYCVDTTYGIVDNKTVLELSDDAANVNWGGSWRMPTSKEQFELWFGCTWEWTDNYKGTNVKGQVGKSKKNGKEIFLPAAGFRTGYGSSFEPSTIGKSGYYWSSSLETELSYTMDARYFRIHSEYVGCYYDFRYLGYSVRAVTE